MIGPKIIVVIQSLAQSTDATGAPTSTWSDLFTVRGVLSQKTEKEKFAAGTDKIFSDYFFWTDYAAGVTEKNRVKYGTRFFNIVGLNNAVELNRILQLDLLEIK